MHSFFRNLSSRHLLLFLALLLALPQGGVRAQSAYVYSQQELEQMLAPIALYPDALLSQILTAATYPAQVVEAARWSKDHADLAGESAVHAAEPEDWDPSVKVLLAFPQLLDHMRDYLQWTQALGDAFLGQQAQLMDTVQDLRRKAQTAGSLRSNEHLSVIESGSDLLLQPVDPRIVYMPFYDPLLAYGTWAWTAYPPVQLRPVPRYYARPAHAGIFRWAPAAGIPAALFPRAIDWPRRQVRVVQVVDHHGSTTVPHAHARPQAAANRPAPWRLEPSSGRSSAYGATETQHRFSAAGAPPPGSVDTDARGGQTREANMPRQPGARPERSSGARIHAEWPAAPQVPRHNPGARREPPRATEAHMAPRPAAAAAPPPAATTAETRHEPAARNQVPVANEPRPAMRPLPPAARQEAAAKFNARP